MFWHRFIPAVMAGLGMVTISDLGFAVGVDPRGPRGDAGFAPLAMVVRTGDWVRFQGLRDPADANLEAEVASLREVLQRLREENGAKVCGTLRPYGRTWHAGKRGGAGYRLPRDLREVEAWAARLAATYGDLVDAWEFANEPDISFLEENPETLAAYHKAVWWGLRRGGAEGAGDAVKQLRGEAVSNHGAVGQGDGGQSDGATEAGAAVSSREAVGGGGLVARNQSLGADAFRAVLLVPPMALPPGPYFERLLENDVLSYTDGFNYHYYGYAEDFAGVYRQWEEAVLAKPESGDLTERGSAEMVRPQVVPGTKWRVTEPGAHQGGRGSKPENGAAVDSDGRLAHGTLPVFLTEYGFGLMDEIDRDTVVGRVRQWDWFREVYSSIQELNIEGPMAFRLSPNLERGINEFGLAVEASPVVHQFAPLRWRGFLKGMTYRLDQPMPGRGDAWTAGGVTFRPADFGETASQPWMRGIGRPLGAGLEASPALAWLLGEDNGATEDGGQRSRATEGRVQGGSANQGGGFLVETREGSPVVIDFFPGEGLAQAKAYRGYMVKGEELVARDSSLGSGGQEDGGQKNGDAEARATERQRLERRSGDAAEVRLGAGTLVVYNFSDTAVTGRLVLPDFLKPDGARQREDGATAGRARHAVEGDRARAPSGRAREQTGDLKPEIGNTSVWKNSAFRSQPSGLSLTLAPGERREIPIEVVVPFAAFAEQRAEVRFDPTNEAYPTSRWVTSFYPWVAGMQRTKQRDFAFPEGDAVESARRLLRRPLAEGEPTLRAQGRWLLTEGVRVEETASLWRFHIDHYPSEPLRPAMAELPLPAGFTFQGADMLMLNYREETLVARSMSLGNEPDARDQILGAESGVTDTRYRTRTGTLPSMLEVLWRTENGSLFGVWPRALPSERWQSYANPATNFTMFFFGRAELPWRFADNQPAALVFHFRPKEIPAVIEVTKPEVVRWEAR